MPGRPVSQPRGRPERPLTRIDHLPMKRAWWARESHRDDLGGDAGARRRRTRPRASRARGSRLDGALGADRTRDAAAARGRAWSPTACCTPGRTGAPRSCSSSSSAATRCAWWSPTAAPPRCRPSSHGDPLGDGGRGLYLVGEHERQLGDGARWRPPDAGVVRDAPPVVRRRRVGLLLSGRPRSSGVLDGPMAESQRRPCRRSPGRPRWPRWRRTSTRSGTRRWPRSAPGSPGGEPGWPPSARSAWAGWRRTCFTPPHGPTCCSAAATRRWRSGLLLVGAQRQRELERALRTGDHVPLRWATVGVFTAGGVALAVMTVVLVIAQT